MKSSYFPGFTAILFYIVLQLLTTDIFFDIYTLYDYTLQVNGPSEPEPIGAVGGLQPESSQPGNE